ncbi:MAG: hypothetical protein LBD21_08905 [Tannerellaceae bacterium]|jgi:hypothetical protein|nr:hypothetical protein [Tannerellaceae bacterium]
MKLKLIIPLLALCCSAASGQELSGYASLMPSTILVEPGSLNYNQALLHNRLNFHWEIAESWRFDAGLRNRFIIGSEEMLSPSEIAGDNGLADLSWNIADGRNHVLNSAFDRLAVAFEKDKWKISLGRQRVNWGQTFVWNPNDIFNTYSFFDFDYPERPGCDALRTTYFHSETSSTELAVAASPLRGRSTVAMLHRWNRSGVDYQVIAGQMSHSDIVAGGAVTGEFRGINLRAEASGFYPLEGDERLVVALSFGADYVFPSALMLQAEVLYNNAGSGASGNGLFDLYSAPLSAKRLSISETNLFAQASYPITPRLNASLSGMMFVDVEALYGGLSADYSLASNLDLSVIAQYFHAAGGSALGDMRMLLAFARLKYSF